MTEDDDEALRRMFDTRKRAPTTGTAFDFARMEILCPQCKQKNLEPIAELVMNDTINCRFCGAIINLKDRQSEIVQFAEEKKKIKKL